MEPGHRIQYYSPYAFMLLHDSIYDFPVQFVLMKCRHYVPTYVKCQGYLPRNPANPSHPFPNLFLHISRLVKLNSPSPNANTIYVVLHFPGLRASIFFAIQFSNPERLRFRSFMDIGDAHPQIRNHPFPPTIIGQPTPFFYSARNYIRRPV